MKLIPTFLLFATPSASAFLFALGPEADPGLVKVIDAQSVQRLSIKLDVGKENGDSRIVIQDLVFDLHKDPPMQEHVAMPGHDGPHPQVSSGPRRLQVLEGGHFISLQGTEHVQILKSCWEVNWAKGSPAGALVCGFELPKSYNRNDATLAKGRIYLSFPVWKEEGLARAREQKAYVMEKVKEANTERDEEMKKCKSTNNIIMKALHYRNAYAAQEVYLTQPVKRMKMVPEEGEVIELQDDLLLTTKGLIWSKALPGGDQTLLGSATIATKPVEDGSVF